MSAHSAAAEPGPGRIAGTDNGSIRVVVGEENFLVREAIGSLLNTTEGVELVATCGDVDTLRAAIEAEQPDVVLIDIRMPPGNRY